MDYLLQLFKSVANERRLEIAELLLKEGELPIEEIAEKLKIPLATCCRNLKALEKVYFVSSRRKRGRALYKLNKPDKHIYNIKIIDMIKIRNQKKASRKR
ncbi:MAG: hypothetical protein B1H08_02675 [Candidatus Omnitrophica bacterium 4484_171]|nr:MAG: hypothetical protein B1H08_02675 [Candidatus Omnitrophica bacterium 4484_171]